MLVGACGPHGWQWYKGADALTIQLLGSTDDKVSPEDNIDLVTGSAFVYLDVPWSGHLTILDMDHTLEGAKRKKVFRGIVNSCG